MITDLKNLNLLAIGNPSLWMFCQPSFSSKVFYHHVLIIHFAKQALFEIPVGTLMSSNIRDYKVGCQIEAHSMPEITKFTSPFFFFHTVKHLSACCLALGRDFSALALQDFTAANLKPWCRCDPECTTYHSCSKLLKTIAERKIQILCLHRFKSQVPVSESIIIVYSWK